MNAQDVRQMLDEEIVREVKVEKSKTNSICEECMNGKLYHAPVPLMTTSERAEHLLDLVHYDIWSPIKCPSMSGARYPLLLHGRSF